MIQYFPLRSMILGILNPAWPSAGQILSWFGTIGGLQIVGNNGLVNENTAAVAKLRRVLSYINTQLDWFSHSKAMKFGGGSTLYLRISKSSEGGMGKKREGTVALWNEEDWRCISWAPTTDCQWIDETINSREVFSKRPWTRRASALRFLVWQHGYLLLQRRRVIMRDILTAFGRITITAPPLRFFHFLRPSSPRTNV